MGSLGIGHNNDQMFPLKVIIRVCLNVIDLGLALDIGCKILCYDID